MKPNRSALLFAVLAFALCVQAAAWCSTASAQVVVLRIDPLAEPLCRVVEAALSDVGLMGDPGYFAEARRRGFDPTSDQALTQLVPPLNARLVVVPLSADTVSLAIDFRDGHSGASLGTVAIPLANGALDANGQSALHQETMLRLGQPSATSEDAVHTTSAPVGAEAPESDETALLAKPFVGVGIGTRDVEWATPGDPATVETGVFAAVEIGLHVALAPSRSFSIGPQFTYQTTLNHEVTEHHVDGEPTTLGIRAHRFEGVLAATIRFGSSYGWYIASALGYGVRNLRAEIHHLLTPSYSLGGPLARLTLRVPFGDDVGLRIGPEAQWLSVGAALQELKVQSSGIGLGGDAALEIAIAKRLSLDFTFREAHAILSSSEREGASASDVERFITVRLVGEI